MQTAHSRAASASKYSPSTFFAGPETSQVRSKRTLPYPLPDPYEEVAEIYDPRGLFTKSRRTSSAHEGKPASEKVSGLALALATAAEAAPRESAASSGGDSRTDERVLPLDSDDSNAHGAALTASLHAASSPSPVPTKFRASNSLSPIPSPARDTHRALRKLRIGSSGAMDMPRPEFVASPATMPIPVPRSQSRGRSDSLQQPQDDEEELRSRGSSPYADVAWSPAVGFLSSFSESNMSGRFEKANQCAGDAEGFEVEGYVLGKELGAGGFGVVREATKIGVDAEKVAVKIVRHAAEPVDSIEVSNLKRSLSGFRGSSRRTSLAAGERNRSSSSPGPPPNLAGRRVGFQDLSASMSSRSRPPPGTISPASISPNPAEVSTSLPPSFEVKSPPSLLQSLLEREISLWQQLAPHPHIVPLLNVHHTADFSYIFMPLCEGGNLLSHLNDHVRSASRSSSSAPRGRAGRKSVEPLMLSSMSEEFTMPESNSSSTTSITAAPQRRGLPLSACLPIFAQVVSGLHYLHTEAAVTHKDVKLENILCDEKGGTWKIADFGLAETGGIEVPRAHVEEAGERRTRSESNESEILTFSVGRGKGHSQAASDRGPIRPITSLASLSRANSLSSSTRGGEETRSATFIIDEHLHPAGSLPYSSPEQMSSPTPILAPSVDVWALGCVLYALVEGRLPFEDMYEPRLRMKILSGEWERPSSLLPSISINGREDVEKKLVLEVLEGCLELDPTKRWTIERVKECDWLNSERKGRGRAGTRPTLLTRNSNTSSNPSPASGSRSPSTTRRKERSTSRGPSTHYGVDPRTRSMERSQVEKEGRKQRWEGRGGVGVLAGRSKSGSRSGSRSRDLSHGSDPY